MNKQELLDDAIKEIERVLVGNKSKDVEEVYLRNAIRFIKQSKPEIAEEQAWRIISEKHNQDETYWEDAKNHYIRSLSEPRQIEVPQFVANWIESHLNTAWWRTIALWENEVPEEDRKVYEWYEDCNEKDFINAWLNGNYIIEREPCWIVERGNGDYVEEVNDSLYELNVSVTSSLDVVSPHRFTDEAKAKAVALLIGGTVKEIPEDEATTRRS